MKVLENNFDVTVGLTETEKVENLKKVISILEVVVEVSLENIKVTSIIYDHDGTSVIDLLEILLKLVKTRNDEGVLKIPKYNLFLD
jgi:C4-type Zn-finger protein